MSDDAKRSMLAKLLMAGASGTAGNILGWPMDRAVDATNLSRAAYGYGGHKLGLLDASQMPDPIEHKNVPGTSERLAAALEVGDSPEEQWAQFAGGFIGPGGGPKMSAVKKPLPNVFYRGTNPGDTRRIKTGVDDWDSHLFAASDIDNAKMYGSHITTMDAAPDAKILHEGTKEWVRVAGKWRKNESMLDYAQRASAAAKAAGYDAAHFERQGDIGTAIFNPDKFKPRGPP